MDLVILVGNIGSGKSTLAKKMVINGYLCISCDSLRYAIGSGRYTYNVELEPLIHKWSKLMVNDLISSNKRIVLDETNISVKLRSEFISLARQASYEVSAVVMPLLSREDSIRRRLQSNHGSTSRETWETVWDKFNKLYEAPSYMEGFDYIRNIKKGVSHA